VGFGATGFAFVVRTGSAAAFVLALALAGGAAEATGATLGAGSMEGAGVTEGRGAIADTAGLGTVAATAGSWREDVACKATTLPIPSTIAPTATAT